MMKPIKRSQKLSLISLALQQHHVKKEKDSLIFPDTVLHNATSLSPQERVSLLLSPLTLKRWQWLNKPAQVETSRFILRAADTQQDSFSIDSDDGRYTLHIEAGREGYFLTAKLSPDWLKHVCRKKGDKYLCQHLMLRLISGEKGNKKIHELDAKMPIPESGEATWDWPLAETTPAQFMKNNQGEMQLAFTNNPDDLRINMRQVNVFFPQIQKHIAQIMVNRMGKPDDEYSLAFALLNKDASMSDAIWNSLIAEIGDITNEETEEFYKYLNIVGAKKNSAGEKDVDYKKDYAKGFARIMLTHISNQNEIDRLITGLDALRKTIKSKKSELEAASYLYRYIENTYCSDLRWRVLAMELAAEQGIAVSPNYLKVLSRVNKLRGELDYKLSNPQQEEHALILAELLSSQLGMDKEQLISDVPNLSFYREDKNKNFPQLLLDYDALVTQKANQQLEKGKAKKQSLNSKKYNNLTSAKTMEKYLSKLVHTENIDSITMEDGVQLYNEDTDQKSPLELLLNEDEQNIVLNKLSDVSPAGLQTVLKMQGITDTPWPELEAEFNLSKHQLVKEAKSLKEYLWGDFHNEFKEMFA